MSRPWNSIWKGPVRRPGIRLELVDVCGRPLPAGRCRIAGASRNRHCASAPAGASGIPPRGQADKFPVCRASHCGLAVPHRDPAGMLARRRDPLVEWLALLNRAVFWFHPLAWWLERKLSALAEDACDAAVLRGGHDAHAYSEYL